jgi:hypothetical protein
MPLGIATHSLNLASPLRPVIVRPITITTQTGATVSTTQSRFGGASLAVNVASVVTTARLTLPASTNFQFGLGEFTYECWIYPTALNGTAGSAGYVLDFRLSSSLQPGITLSGLASGSTGNIIVTGMNTTITNTLITSSVTVNTNNWHHIALTRSGSTVTLWINGTSRGTATNTESLNATGITPTIGRGATSTAQNFRGYIDEVRVSQIARYTATFTPPTSAFVNDADTVFLMHADGANGSTTFTDDNS